MSTNAIHWVVLGGAFAILWFLALQIVIPIGVRTPYEMGDSVEAGHDPGAPAHPRILLKIGWATAAALLMWLVLYTLVLAGIVTL